MPDKPEPLGGLAVAALFFGGILTLLSLYMTVAPAYLMYQDHSRWWWPWAAWGLGWTLFWANMTWTHALRAQTVHILAKQQKEGFSSGEG